MIVSANSDAEIEEFNLLLKNTIIHLNKRARITSKNISEYSGKKLEPYIKDVMTDLAYNTSFRDSIELISGQKFPDIVAKKYYGVEVKTTTQNHWKTTGNSVLESTRVDNVDRIYMLFAKLATPIEFRCRPYDEVLSEVVVTHSPRYLIDMTLEKGNTIFDKIKIPYNTLRKEDNPIKSIVKYYKSNLKEGEELWWMDNENNSKPSNIVIRIWSNLSPIEKQSIINRAMIFFPELFGNSPNKFGRFAIWLVTQEAVVCQNVRDIFTAGGRGQSYVMNETLYDVPRILLNLLKNISFIVSELKNISAAELSHYWNKTVIDNDKLKDWIELVSEHTCKIVSANKIDVKRILSQFTSETTNKFNGS